MKVYSGKCLMGVCGTPTSFIDINDNDLFVGDIVMIFTVDKDGVYKDSGSLSVVVDGKYTTYTDGTIEEKDNHDFFVMGIKSAWPEYHPNDPEEREWMIQRWHVRRVKKWQNVIDGERWADFGFNYRAEG